jgi:WhiB family redox-sensing transcriptional regulator
MTTVTLTDALPELTHMTPETPDHHSRSSILMNWRNRAACLEEDPELFFPIGNTGPALLQIEEAKAVCRRCEVVETCLKWAIESGQDAGVWGGLSEDERRALKRRNARARRAG